MRIYVGSTGKLEFVERLREKDIGRVMIPDSTFVPYPEEKWVLDNGAYSLWLKSKPFDDERYLNYVERRMNQPAPQFAVVPDIVADGLRSLEFSINWLNRIPREWKWYLALQDGMSYQDVEDCIDLFDGLFVGGTLRFKGEVKIWVNLGEQHGKPVHFGRCGIHSRLDFASRAGCASADSSFPLWTKERMGLFLSWITEGHYDPKSYRQMFLPMEPACTAS